ncbi:MAG TPA: sodium:proton antiporter, partial [Clostridiales bacterium]|nr:sodium:proton antiporter [Clostridiales bacterium]
MENMEHHGVISLIPVAVVILSAILTKRTTESLLFGSIAGFIALHGVNFFMPWLDAVYEVMMDSTTAWVILLFSLFGSLIALLEKSGGALGFSKFAVKVTKSRGISLTVTWILGIIVFIDDYLNALAVGSVMRQVTDHYRVSREMLAYVVNSTGAAVCVLIPFSTWSAFMAGQLEANNVLVNGSATAAYIASIPYSFYAWTAVLIVPLIIWKIVPIYGGMKKAEMRALETGQVFPEGSQV